MQPLLQLTLVPQRPDILHVVRCPLVPDTDVLALVVRCTGSGAGDDCPAYRICGWRPLLPAGDGRGGLSDRGGRDGCLRSRSRSGLGSEGLEAGQDAAGALDGLGGAVLDDERVEAEVLV